MSGSYVAHFTAIPHSMPELIVLSIGDLELSYQLYSAISCLAQR